MPENTLDINFLQEHLTRVMDEVSAKFKEVAEQRQKDHEARMKEYETRQKEFEETQKKRQKEYEERQKERQKEYDDRQKELQREMKETNRRFGELTNRFGELAEHLVVPNIEEKFNALGFNFNITYQNAQIRGTPGRRAAEVDILLENGNSVIAVEVKSKPVLEDVEKHIYRMEVLRRLADERKDTRIYLGAIAGAIMSTEVRECILSNGFYAIEQTGDTVMINVPEGFKPRQW